MIASPNILGIQKNVVIMAIFIIASAVAVFVFLPQVDGRVLARQFSVSAPKDLSLEAATGAKKSPILEVHIASNGAILLRNARVISITDSNLRVAMEWDLAHFIWRVQTNSYKGTTFPKSKGESGTFEDIQVGDLITVNGTLVGSGAEPIINAQIIRLE